MKLLTHLFLLVCLSGLTAAAWVGHRTPDLSGVAGADPSGPTVDISDALEQAEIKRSAPIEITEADLNRYLVATVAGVQKGRTAKVIAFEKMLIDLEPGVARVTLCWLTRGYRTTTSLDLQVSAAGSKHRVEIVKGAYGRLPVARGFILPVLPAYQALAAACDAELKKLFNMTKIQIAKDKLVLDPRF